MCLLYEPLNLSLRNFRVCRGHSDSYARRLAVFQADSFKSMFFAVCVFLEQSFKTGFYVFVLQLYSKPIFSLNHGKKAANSQHPQLFWLISLCFISSTKFCGAVTFIIGPNESILIIISASSSLSYATLTK